MDDTAFHTWDTHGTQGIARCAVAKDPNKQENGMVAAERRRIICNWASQYGSVKVVTLAEALGVGENTIRNDLDRLHREGRLLRVHGGAVPKSGSTPRRPYAETKSARLDEKSKIGAAALAYIPDFGTIFIGPGTTTYELAIRLPSDRPLRVVTNSLEIATYVASHQIAPVDFTGGSIRTDSLASDWSLSEEAVASLYWDVAFVGAAAIDISRGITTLDRGAARWERLIIDHARKVVVLCDSSKLGQFSYAQVGPLNLIDVLITDEGVPPEFAQQLSEEDVELVIAGQEQDLYSQH